MEIMTIAFNMVAGILLVGTIAIVGIGARHGTLPVHVAILLILVIGFVWVLFIKQEPEL